jgi:hypothetical protein
LGATELRELRPLRDDSAKLKRLAADLALAKYILGKDVRKETLETLIYLHGVTHGYISSEREHAAADAVGV